MNVCGFTFIRNAIKYDYPIKEAILSILPLCDKVIVAVGQSEDATLELIQSIDPEKVVILETVWDESLREGGKVLADETNKAFAEIAEEYDWAFYIQGDEVIHEKYYDSIRASMQQYKDAEEIDGLLFKYQHFYGSYDYLGESNRWYRREIRIVRPQRTIYSYKDAQGFRKGNNEKLAVKLIDAYVYHYGWVKDPRAQQRKQQSFNTLWHDDQWMKENIPDVEEFDYSQIDALKHFEGTHPKVMQERIERVNWEFSFDPTTNRFKTKEKLVRLVEKITGRRIGEYQNYRIV